MARRKIVTEMEASSPSAATLQPGAGSSGAGDPMSRVGMMNDIVGSLSQMSTDDLTKLKETLAQIGQEAANIPDGAAASNVASISAKAAASEAMREDLQTIFSTADSTLTEEFVDRATTLFESAVALQANLVIEQRTQALEEQFHQAMDEYEEHVVDSLDQYLDYFAEQYMEENKLVIEHSIRNELLDSFMTGLHDLMKEHYIDIPEDKVDVVESLIEKVEFLEQENSELLEQMIETKSVATEVAKNKIVEQAAASLTAIQASKLRTLVEDIEVDSIETFEKKVGVIKEHYFSRKGSVAGSQKELIIESTPAVDVNDVYEDDKVSNSTMSRYVQAIARTAK